LAGPIDRVEQINPLLNQVAMAQPVPVETRALQPLFDGNTLKSNLTIDGVHLNAAGLWIYRAALLKIMSRASSADFAISTPDPNHNNHPRTKPHKHTGQHRTLLELAVGWLKSPRKSLIAIHHP
jgi:hypothetical protein